MSVHEQDKSLTEFKYGDVASITWTPMTSGITTLNLSPIQRGNDYNQLIGRAAELWKSELDFTFIYTQGASATGGPGVMRVALVWDLGNGGTPTIANLWKDATTTGTSTAYSMTNVLQGDSYRILKQAYIYVGSTKIDLVNHRVTDTIQPQDMIVQSQNIAWKVDLKKKGLISKFGPVANAQVQGVLWLVAAMTGTTPGVAPRIGYCISHRLTWRDIQEDEALLTKETPDRKV